jgi:hypothetical protein
VGGRPPADPLGKRAFFWLPVEEPARPRAPRSWVPGRRSDPVAAADPPSTGKHALYSSTDATCTSVAPSTADDEDRSRGPIGRWTSPGRFAVHCRSCGETTAVGLLELAMLHTPVGAFVPLRRFDHLLRCPACHRRTWAGVSLAR